MELGTREWDGFIPEWRMSKRKQTPRDDHTKSRHTCAQTHANTSSTGVHSCGHFLWIVEHQCSLWIRPDQTYFGSLDTVAVLALDTAHPTIATLCVYVLHPCVYPCVLPCSYMYSYMHCVLTRIHTWMALVCIFVYSIFKYVWLYMCTHVHCGCVL